MNDRTRNKCLEVPVNSVERDTIKDFARHVGMAAAVFARFAMFQYIETHDAKAAAPVESRKRRDAPIASRASVGRASQPAMRQRDRVRVGAGMRPIRV